MVRQVSVYCPECESRIVLNPHAELGQRFKCRWCETDLEVVSVDPLEIDWVDDWDDDDESDW